jgi:hypothetical protein
MSQRNRMITEDLQTIKLRLFQTFIDKELDKVKTNPDTFILQGWDNLADKIKERVKRKRQEQNHVI